MPLLSFLRVQEEFVMHLWTMAFIDTILIKTHNLSLSYKLMVDAIFSVILYSYLSYYLKDSVAKYIGFEDTGEGRSKKTLDK